MINKTYPPLLASHQGQVKIKSSPLGVLVSKMKPIMTTVIGHPQKKSCMKRKNICRHFNFYTVEFVIYLPVINAFMMVGF